MDLRKCPKCGDRLPQYEVIPAAELAALREKADAGATFKAFVHRYLTEHGVPEGDPTNQHQKEGCRIGARLDLLFAQRDKNAKLELRDALLAAEGVKDGPA